MFKRVCPIKLALKFHYKMFSPALDVELGFQVQIMHIFIQYWEHFSSVSQSCPILCNPMDRSTPGLPVHHQLPELTQNHVH